MKYYESRKWFLSRKKYAEKQGLPRFAVEFLYRTFQSAERKYKKSKDLKNSSYVRQRLYSRANADLSSCCNLLMSFLSDPNIPENKAWKPKTVKILKR